MGLFDKSFSFLQHLLQNAGILIYQIHSKWHLQIVLVLLMLTFWWIILDQIANRINITTTWKLLKKDEWFTLYMIILRYELPKHLIQVLWLFLDRLSCMVWLDNGRSCILPVYAHYLSLYHSFFMVICDIPRFLSHFQSVM